MKRWKSLEHFAISTLMTVSSGVPAVFLRLLLLVQGPLPKPNIITKLINSNDDHDGDDNDAIRRCPSPRTIFHPHSAFLHFLLKYENTNFAVN